MANVPDSSSGSPANAGFDNRGVAQRHFRRLDGFDGERAADTRDLAVHLWLIDQFFLIGVCGDAGVDLVHLGPPRRAVFLDGFLQIGGVIRIGIERNVPMLPALVLRQAGPSGGGRHP